MTCILEKTIYHSFTLEEMIFRSWPMLTVLFWAQVMGFCVLVALCRGPHEPDEAVASTSSASRTEKGGSTDQVNLSVYSSSRQGFDKSDLEASLVSFYQEALSLQAQEQSLPTQVEGKSGEEGQREEKPRVLKKRRVSPPQDSPGEGTSSGPTSANQYKNLPPLFLAEYSTFLRTYILDLIILENETRLYNSNKLYYTPFWLDRNMIGSNNKFLHVLLQLWEKRGFTTEIVLKEEMSLYFNDKRLENSRAVFDWYLGPYWTEANMIIVFFYNLKSFDCNNIKRSLAALILVFEFCPDLLHSTYLFFLLMCSIKELQGVKFSRGFSMFIKNKNMVRARILKIGGPHVKLFCEELKKNIRTLSEMKITRPKENKMFPLAMETVDIENFGLRFCLALFELYLLQVPSLIMNNLIFFFGSRLASSLEVLLAFDIVAYIKSFREDIQGIVTSFIYDSNIKKSLQRRILNLHNVDISKIYGKIQQCLEVKGKYSELSGLVQLTDYQISSANKQITSKK